MSRFHVTTVLILLSSLALSLIHPRLGQAQSAPSTFSSQRWTAPRRAVPKRSAVGQSDLAEQPEVALANAELGSDLQSLPDHAGQVWREYDIGRIVAERAGGSSDSKPEQAIVDWILRETGTDVWFGEPLGVLSANDQKLRVYHTADVQSKVAEIVERFTEPDAAKQTFGVRLVTLASPDWRAKAMSRLVPVDVQSPGVEAWLMSREDAAVVLEQIRHRGDFREHSSPILLIRNGQTHLIERRRPVAYVRGMRAMQNGAGGYIMDMSQINEGFSLAVSPLLSKDQSTTDAVIRLETTQIEKLTTIPLPTPTADNANRTSPVQVPQTSSWRLHERFRWPSHQVLLISCGLVADPGPNRNGILGLRAISRPPRTEALLFVEAKGRFHDLISTPQSTSGKDGLNYRGRY